jgi:hypothetical protein
MRKSLSIACLLIALLSTATAFGQAADAPSGDAPASEALTVPENFVKLPAGTVTPLPEGITRLGSWFAQIACDVTEVPALQQRYDTGAAGECAADVDNGTACTDDGSACLCWEEESCLKVSDHFACGFCEDGYCYGYEC